MSGNMPLDNEMDEHEENPLGDVPYFLDLKKVAKEARKATKA